MMLSDGEKWYLARIEKLETENAQLRKGISEWVDLTMKGEAVRERVMLEIALQSVRRPP